MDPLQSSYLARLARVGAVLLASAVLIALVVRAQRRAVPSGGIATEKKLPVLQLESMRVVDEEQESRRLELLSSTKSLSAPLFEPGSALVPQTRLLDRVPLDTSTLQIAPLRVDQSLVGAEPLQLLQDPYVSSSKSAVIEITDPRDDARDSRRP